MIEIQIKLLIDALTDELFAQGLSGAIDAPVVWQIGNSSDFISIDGVINLRRLALAIIGRRP